LFQPKDILTNLKTKNSSALINKKFKETSRRAMLVVVLPMSVNQFYFTIAMLVVVLPMSETFGLALVHCLVLQVDEIFKDDPHITRAQTRIRRTVKRLIQVLAHQMIDMVPQQDENDLLSNSTYRVTHQTVFLT
jgi:hypothetical protein